MSSAPSALPEAGIRNIDAALANGFTGMRVSGNAFWIGTHQWHEFCEYEKELDHSMAGRSCWCCARISWARAARVDILDVARAHKFSLAPETVKWGFLETPELAEARKEIRRLSGALRILSNPFPGHET